jgi:hypothetical protein
MFGDVFDEKMGNQTLVVSLYPAPTAARPAAVKGLARLDIPSLALINGAGFGMNDRRQ